MFDVIVIGSGIVGASLAYELSRREASILVLEKENDVAMGTTKANSAIVHAGYDPEPGSLMARLNVAGSAKMQALCRSLDVEYERIGSLVLAFTPEDQQTIRKLYENGCRNGVPELQLLSREQALQLEPALSPDILGALLAPSAAIVDPWGLCIAEAETAVRNGVQFLLSTPVTGIDDMGDHRVVHTPAADYKARFVVNCAGTHGHEISAMTGPAEWEPHPRRGQYYLLDKSSGGLVRHVIFQCPTPEGKGVLLAPTVHGNLIVGPSSETVDDGEDRATTAEGLAGVLATARKSVPGVDARQSIRNFAGVRAATNEDDFIIRPSTTCPGLIHAAGIKSPGLSAAPAIADYVIGLLRDAGLTLTPKADWDGHREQIRFRRLSAGEKAALIARDPRYGRVICRCETITEGEIVSAIHSPLPARSIDGVKRRAGAGMGRCQGGFCGPRVLAILARELGCDPLDIPQDGSGTQPLLVKTKGGRQA